MSVQRTPLTTQRDHKAPKRYTKKWRMKEFPPDPGSSDKLAQTHGNSIVESGRRRTNRPIPIGSLFIYVPLFMCASTGAKAVPTRVAHQIYFPEFRIVGRISSCPWESVMEGGRKAGNRRNEVEPRFLNIFVISVYTILINTHDH